MALNIDEVNKGYSYFLILVGVVLILQNVYKYLSKQPSPVSDWAGVIVLVVGYFVLKWLFKKKKK